MSTSSNKNSSKEEKESNSDSDFEMSKEERSSDQTSNNNGSQDELQERQIKEQNKLAEKLKKETDIYMNKQNKSKAERFQFFVNQTKTYANYIINGKLEDKENKDRKLLSKKKRKNSEAEGNVDDIKILENNNLDEDELKLENRQITRLYFQPSSLTGGQLTGYQLDGLNWLISLYERNLNGILADEMGLGKTIQSIALMAYLKQFKKKNGFFLVIVPKSTMPNWSRECKKWIPTLDCLILNPVKEEREETLKLINEKKFEVVITSYEGVNICINKLKKIKWELLIIDEAHRIKNENALLSKNVRLLQSKFRLLVTGTPLQNNLHELWALLNFLMPNLFSSSSEFDDLFGVGNNKEDGEENKEKME